MMNKVFKDEIGEILEVYMEGMTIKSSKDELHDYHLTHVLWRV